MEVDEKAREQPILDVTAELLLRHGYNKVTMSDVADAAGLNRRLVYLLFPSRDALIKALLLREVNTYWGPILLGLVGLGLIGAGILVTDPGLGYPYEASTIIVTVHGTIHSIISLFFVFIPLPAACFVLARRDAADPAAHGWAWYSVATGLLVVVFVVLTFVATALNGPAGLTQRIFLIVGLSWIAVLAIRLMGRSVPLT